MPDGSVIRNNYQEGTVSTKGCNGMKGSSVRPLRKDETQDANAS